jgi:hypothetical protein
MTAQSVGRIVCLSVFCLGGGAICEPAAGATPADAGAAASPARTTPAAEMPSYGEQVPGELDATDRVSSGLTVIVFLVVALAFMLCASLWGHSRAVQGGASGLFLITLLVAIIEIPTQVGIMIGWTPVESSFFYSEPEASGPLDAGVLSPNTTSPPTTAPRKEHEGATEVTETSGSAYLHLVKAQPVIWGAFGYMSTADATLTMENGDFARAVPEEAGEVIVYQFFPREWEGVSSQPYWAYTFDAVGNSTRPPLLVISADDFVLFGPCRTETGAVPPGLPVVGVADVRVFTSAGRELGSAPVRKSQFYTFDPATPAGEDPLEPVGGSFQVPDIPVTNSAPWK